MERGSTFSRAAAAVILLLSLLVSCGQSQESRWQEQYDLGMRYLSQGNYQEAVIAFTAAIEIDPKRAEALIGRGDAYVLLGETEDNLSAALADYQAALDLDEALVSAWLGLADVYVLQGDYDRALEILQEALEKTGQAPDIQDRLTRLEEETGSPQALFEAFLEQEGYSELQDSWIYGVPSEYALLDVNGDGWEELILSGGNGTGFFNYAVFVCSRESREIVPDMIGSDALYEGENAGSVSQYYGTLYYSPQYQALVYTELNNGSMFGGFGYHTLEEERIGLAFSVNFEVDYATRQQSYDLYRDGVSQPLTQAQYQDYLDEREPVEFVPLPAPQASSKPDLAQYMGTDLQQLAAMFEGMENAGATDGTTEYSNGTIIISDSFGNSQVGYISINGPCEYAICGVEYGMSWDDACRLTETRSQSVLSRTDSHVRYVLEDRTILGISTADGETVSSINYFAPE